MSGDVSTLEAAQSALPVDSGGVESTGGEAVAGPAGMPHDPPALARLRRLLERSDVRIVGANDPPARPWDVCMHDPRLPRRLLFDGALGLGDSYVDGWWDCADLPEFFSRVMRHDLAADLIDWRAWAAVGRQTLINVQRTKTAHANGRDHYDRGNDLFRGMLDDRMTYTCAYWEQGGEELADLGAAQEAKLEMTCRKIGLQRGDRVLDIGCGWGSFAKYAAEHFGANVVGITVAREQIDYARADCQGLPCEFRLQDYRELPAAGERFDHVVSLGMFEHVGPKNARTYMKVVAEVLKPDGLFLLHTISTRRSQPNRHDSEIVWMDRHIFPGLSIPSLAQIGRAIDGRFVVEDLHNFGVHYEKTLLAWHRNFVANWPTLRDRYGDAADRFYRMWTYYLLTCAGAFRSRKYGLWQCVLSPLGVPGGWTRPR